MKELHKNPFLIYPAASVCPEFGAPLLVIFQSIIIFFASHRPICSTSLKTHSSDHKEFEIKKKLEEIASKSGKDRKKKSASIPGVKKSVAFDDFAKLDLRVARVVEAERLQGSNKMLKLIVDIGVEKRQIVAGIAKFYEPEQLVGKDVVIVANLEPKQIMGHESQGMVLAGGESDRIVVLNPDGPAAAGSRIS